MRNGRQEECDEKRKLERESYVRWRVTDKEHNVAAITHKHIPAVKKHSTQPHL